MLKWFHRVAIAQSFQTETCKYYCFSSGKMRKGDSPVISQHVSEIHLFPDACCTCCSTPCSRRPLHRLPRGQHARRLKSNQQLFITARKIRTGRSPCWITDMHTQTAKVLAHVPASPFTRRSSNTEQTSNRF